MNLEKKLLSIILFSVLFLDFTSIALGGDVSVRVFQLFIPIMLVYIIYNVKYIRNIRSFEIVLFVLYFYLGLTFFWSVDVVLSLKLMILEVMLLITYIYFRIVFFRFSIVKLENLFIKVGIYYIIGSIIFYLVGIYSFSLNPIIGQETYFGLLQESILPRLRGFAESPNAFIPFSLFFLVFFIDKKKKIMVVITLVSIVLSFSTTGMLIAISILFVSYFNKISLKLVIYILLIFVVFLLLYLNFIQNNEDIMRMIQWRMERNQSGTGRFELWEYAMDLISHNIYGYGINSTRLVIHDFHALNSVHNSVVEVFLTGGFISLFLYLLLYMTIFIESIYIWRNRNNKKMFLLFLIFFLIGMSNNTLHITYTMFSLAVLYQYSEKQRRVTKCK